MEFPYPFKQKSWLERLVDYIRDWREHTYYRHSRMPLFIKLWLVLIMLVGTLIALYVLQASTDLRKKATPEDGAYPLLIELVQDRDTGEIGIKSARYTTYQPELVSSEGSASYTLSASTDDRSIDAQPVEFVDSIPVDDFDVLLGNTTESTAPHEYVLPERLATLVIRYTPEAALSLVNNQDRGQIALDTTSLDTMIGAPPRSEHHILAPNRDTLDITFVSSNYQDFDQFHRDVDAMVSKLFATYPFTQFQELIAIHVVDNSADLGCHRVPPPTDPGDPPSRLIVCSRFEVAQAASQTPYDTLVVVENTNDYGGSGSYGLAVTYGHDSSAPTVPAKVFVHEFGHSFGLLADEYDYRDLSVPNPVPVNYYYYPRWPNCDNSSTCEKWGNTPGCHAICGYTNLYRPTSNDSLMRTLNPSHGWQFGPVSEEALTSRLQLYTPLTADLDHDGDIDFTDYQRATTNIQVITQIIADYASTL